MLRPGPPIHNVTKLCHRLIGQKDKVYLLALKSEVLKASKTSAAISMTFSSFFVSLASLLASQAVLTIDRTHAGRLVQTSYMKTGMNPFINSKNTTLTRLTA